MRPEAFSVKHLENQSKSRGSLREGSFSSNAVRDTSSYAVLNLVSAVSLGTVRYISWDRGALTNTFEKRFQFQKKPTYAYSVIS